MHVGYILKLKDLTSEQGIFDQLRQFNFEGILIRAILEYFEPQSIPKFFCFITIAIREKISVNVASKSCKRDT